MFKTALFKRFTLIVTLLMACYVAPSAICADATPAAGPAVVMLGGEVAHPLTLDVSALAKLPHVTVQAVDHGVRGSWSGVPLSAILSAGGVPIGEALRGKNLALYVRISAADGYRVVYALAELDPQFRDEPVILADLHDGKSLGFKQGPFRVVAPTDKRPARWIRQVIRIDVLRAPDSGS